MTISQITKSAKQGFDKFRFWASGYSRAMSSWFSGILSGSNLNFRKLAGKGYDNTVVLAAINWIWRNLQYPRAIIEKREKGKKGKSKFVETDHPAIEAWEACPFYDTSTMIYGLVLSLIADGNGYLYVQLDRLGYPEYLVYIPHHQIEPNGGDTETARDQLISHYRYTTPDGDWYDLPPEVIVHCRIGVDPENQAKGLAPIAGTLREIAGENEAATLSLALSRNAGIPGLVITPRFDKQVITDEQKTRIKELFRRNSTGDAAGTPLVPSMAIDVNVVGFKPDELALDKTRAINVSRICAAIGLDPMVLGLPSETKTYSNYKEANEAAWEGLVLPLLKVIAKQITQQFVWRYYGNDKNFRFGWDLTDVRALSEDLDALWGRIVTAWQSGLIKRSEGKTELGLDVDETQDDVYKDDLSAGLNQEQAAAQAKIAKQRRQREASEVISVQDIE